MNLSEHFTLEEFERSATAVERGINNTAPDTVVPCLVVLAENMEKVRTLLNAPLHINSGYRCLGLNTAVKGAPNSAHVQGLAADFVCPQFGTPLQIVRKIVESGIKFDQCIQEGGWVHISFDPRMRQRTLTAHFASDGTVSYREGVA